MILGQNGRHGGVGLGFNHFHAAHVLIAAVNVQLLAYSHAVVGADREFHFADRNSRDRAGNRNRAGIGRIFDRHAQTFENGLGLAHVHRQLRVTFLQVRQRARGHGQLVGQVGRFFDLLVGLAL